MRRTIGPIMVYLATSMFADAAPRVAVDIAPLQSLTAQVMEGVGAPELILPSGASPHSYAMRPSDATALQEAEVVIRIGGGLTPWFDKARAALASDAVDAEMSAAPGVVRLPSRPGGAFGDQPVRIDTGQIDPHLWLDPENARTWLTAISVVLSEADPANAATYAANASAAQAELDTLSKDIEELLAPVRGRPYLVFHDAYQYFTARFEIPASGAIASSDAERPGPARIAEMRALAERSVCIFAEPQFEPRLIAPIVEGTAARMATLDPAGAALPPGLSFYRALLLNLATDLSACLGRE